MSDPVTVAEASLLARDQESQPWQQVLVATISAGLTRAELLSLIDQRISYAPRFRRVVTGWPLPVWSDDPNFNLGGHVSEASLLPGQRLEDWLADQLGRGLPRNHPLWQVTLVNLAPGSQAVVARVHPALVDGYDHVHLFQELLDDQPEDVSPAPATDWQPAQAPQNFASLAAGLGDPLKAAQQGAAGLFGMLENAMRTVVTQPRRLQLSTAEVELAAVKAIARAFGCTTHDVLLALATAGLRGWLAEQGRPLVDELAMVPLAVAEPQVLESAIGCRVAPSFERLPVTAASATERLTAIATITRARSDSGVSVPARDLIDLAGFAPATLFAVAAGCVGSGRPHLVTVTNVPGPDEPRYLGRARVRNVYALSALTDSEQLNVSIASFRGHATITVVADAPVTTWAASVSAELSRLEIEAR